jgi:ABC-type multidrug transport system fused ATPase/permease subunit
MAAGIINYSLDSVRFYLTSAQKRRTVLLFILTLISSFMEVVGLASLVPVMLVAAEPGGVKGNKYFGPIYQTIGFQSESNFLVFLIVLIFIFFLAKNLFSTWVNYMQARFTAEVGISIIKTQLNKYLNLPFWYFNDYGSSNLINSTLSVPSAYVTGIVRSLLGFFSEMIIVIVIVIGILLYKPLLFLVLALILLPTAVVTYRILRARSQKIGNRINELRPISYAIIGDLFNGFAELKLANKQRSFEQNLVANQNEVQNLDAEAYLFSLLPTKMIEMVAIIGVLTIFLYAILFPSNSTNLIALVGLFAAAAYRLMPSMNRILTALVQLKQFQYTIENLESYRAAKYNESLHPQQLPLSFDKDIVFNNLYFSFPEEQKPTLRNVNITIRKGEKIGFIGSSGSGKTTLMNILLRFYSEQKGAILIDGQPLTPQHLQAWHSIVGYVKQDTFLMEASIQDNITLGDPKVDKERMHYAIEQASLQAFISGLPEGVGTLIGERGSKLSGGQRQRIGIARALYKQTEVLVLDEATSALDNETEREVNEAINKLSKTDITILIIAHRITTLRECDRIYELSHGEVIAEHSYDDIVKKIIQPN